uniref:ketohexokinase-like isoform X1 n=1 Tax=Styela clava TaxID=7725 RepID=UPI00193A04F2|nr:ketohexokinase-like isoform X1 [Styela clava]
MLIMEDSKTSLTGFVACVGLVCVDIVNTCSKFPSEDSDQRSLSLYWQRGGNAANTCTVLSILGSKTKFIGSAPTMNSDDLPWGLDASRFALQGLEKYGVDISDVHHWDCVDFPTSSVIVNKQNGSRTIMHFRGDLPELNVEAFQNLDLGDHAWFHFEGRPNIDVIISAMNMIVDYNESRSETEKISMSVELEKPHVTNLFSIAKLADLVFVSTDYAKFLGYTSAIECVEGIKNMVSNRAEIVCTWGSSGAAFGINTVGDVSTMVPAIPPDRVVDTIGAGDSFIAGVIHARSQGHPLDKSVQFGCRVAEKKISNCGFDHMKGFKPPI